MRFKEGMIGQSPVIDKIRFEYRGKMSIYLDDGRVIIIPLTLFPSIRKLNDLQRKKYHISDGQIILFRDSDEVFHIEQFIGSEPDYRYSFLKKNKRASVWVSAKTYLLGQGLIIITDFI